MTEFSRREALQVGSMAMAAGLAGGLGSGASATTKTPNVSAASVPVGTNFPEKMWKQQPWTFDVKPPYDLEDPVQRWAALLKCTQNLLGARTYVSSYSQVYLTEVGKQTQNFYGTCGSWTYQLVVPEPGQFPQFGTLPENTALQLGLYTGVVLDPATFRPVDEIYNPILDKKVTPKDSIFAESYLIYPGGGMTSIERSQFMNDRAPRKHSYVKSGNNFSWILPALFAGEGDFQPRMDSSWWTAKYGEMMDPSNDLIDCDYSWASQTRAAEKPWWGMQDLKGGIYGTFWNTHGTVTNKLSNVEAIVQEYVFNKYPDRI